MIPLEGKKIITLAPMAGYTDFVYRSVVRDIHLEMATTEMISVKALVYKNEDSWKYAIETISEPETGIQLFGYDPEDFRKAIEMIEANISPLFFELNAGCPVKKVVKKGAGAYLLKDLKQLEKILKSMKSVTHRPIALKTRLGWDHSSIVIRDVVNIAENSGASWITIHGRTRAQMYTGKSNIELIGSVASEARIPIIANGDIKTKDQVIKLFSSFPIAGIAVGRAAIGNPWIFRIMRNDLEPSYEEKLKVVMKHLDKSIEYYGKKRGVLKMIPHLVKYLKSIPGAKKYRELIVRERDPYKLKLIIEEAFGAKEPA